MPQPVLWKSLSFFEFTAKNKNLSIKQVQKINRSAMPVQSVVRGKQQESRRFFQHYHFALLSAIAAVLTGTVATSLLAESP